MKTHLLLLEFYVLTEKTAPDRGKAGRDAKNKAIVEIEVTLTLIIL